MLALSNYKIRGVCQDRTSKINQTSKINFLTKCIYLKKKSIEFKYIWILLSACSNFINQQ